MSRAQTKETPTLSTRGFVEELFSFSALWEHRRAIASAQAKSTGFNLEKRGSVHS